MKVCDCKFSTAWGAAFSHRCASGSFLYRDGAASQRRLALVRDLRERESKMSVQRRSFVSTGPTRDDPAVNQIWAEWRRDGSGLRQGSLGVLVSVTVLSTWFIVLIYGRLTLTSGLGFGLPFSVTLCWLASCYSTTSLWVRIIRISVNLRCVHRGPVGCRATGRSAGGV